jgi:hypothetical protein
MAPVYSAGKRLAFEAVSGAVRLVPAAQPRPISDPTSAGKSLSSPAYLPSDFAAFTFVLIADKLKGTRL